MKKQTWKLWTGVWMAALMLIAAGCSGGAAGGGAPAGSGNPAPGSAADGNGGGKVKLEYWTRAQQEEIEQLKEIIFKDVLKEVDINFVTVPTGEYENKLRIAINGGKAPDIFEVDGVYTSNYAHNGALLELDPYWDREDFEDYVNSSKEKTMYNGKRYAASLHETSVVVFYNKDHFAKAGIMDVPSKFSEAWTWEQYLEAAKKLTQTEGGKTTVYGAIPGWKAPDNASEAAVFTHLLFIWNNGGQVTDEKLTTAKGYLDSDKTVQVLQFYQDFFQKHKVAPMESITKSLEGFEVGKLSMFLGNISIANTLKKNYPDINFGVMPVPVGEKKYATSGGWNIGISSQTKHPKEAWKVIEALTGKEGHLKYAEFKGFIPSRKSALEAMKSLNEFPLNVAKDSMPYAKARPITPAYAEISPIIGEMMNAIAYGNDVKTEATNAAAAIDKVLQKYAK